MNLVAHKLTPACKGPSLILRQQVFLFILSIQVTTNTASIPPTARAVYGKFTWICSQEACVCLAYQNHSWTAKNITLLRNSLLQVRQDPMILR